LPLIEITTRSTRPLVAERRRALTDLAGAGPAERLSPTPHKRKEQSCQRPTFYTALQRHNGAAPLAGFITAINSLEAII
jgi:hypothetical protein